MIGEVASVVKDQWPTLFTHNGSMAHANLLTGQRFMSNITSVYAEQGKLILSFLKADFATGGKKTARALK